MRKSCAGKCIFCGKMWKKVDINKDAVYLYKEEKGQTIKRVVSCVKHHGVKLEVQND